MHPVRRKTAHVVGNQPISDCTHDLRGLVGILVLGALGRHHLLQLVLVPVLHLVCTCTEGTKDGRKESRQAGRQAGRQSGTDPERQLAGRKKTAMH